MRQDAFPPEDDEEDEYLGPSKSQLKREQLELQALGKEMTKLGDEQLRKLGSPKTCMSKLSNSAA